MILAAATTSNSVAPGLVLLVVVVALVVRFLARKGEDVTKARAIAAREAAAQLSRAEFARTPQRWSPPKAAACIVCHSCLPMPGAIRARSAGSRVSAGSSAVSGITSHRREPPMEAASRLSANGQYLFPHLNAHAGDVDIFCPISFDYRRAQFGNAPLIAGPQPT